MSCLFLIRGDNKRLFFEQIFFTNSLIRNFVFSAWTVWCPPLLHFPSHEIYGLSWKSYPLGRQQKDRLTVLELPPAGDRRLKWYLLTDGTPKMAQGEGNGKWMWANVTFTTAVICDRKCTIRNFHCLKWQDYMLSCMICSGSFFPQVPECCWHGFTPLPPH